MVEKAGEDYAEIIKSVGLDREINPLCTNIEDMLARLDEFETLLSNVKVETNGILENHVSSINSFSEQFETLRERIDSLEQFVGLVSANVDELEKSVDIAKAEFNITDNSYKGLLLKPLLAKAKMASTAHSVNECTRTTNLDSDGKFQKIKIFETSNYFEGNENSQEN